ncbi:MAG TPA: transposase [Roseiflexaceae bacterium]|nr:transposase [Roseiflexaceae bacterium]
MRIIHTSYRYRLEPTRDQEKHLRNFAGARRWVWNWGLARKREHYQATKSSISYHTLCGILTHLKRIPETAWLNEINAQLLQQALRDLESAFKNFFAKRARYPRFKSKKTDRPRFRIPQGVYVEQKAVYIPKIGYIKACIHRPIVGTPKSATFSQEPDGHWYVAVVVEQEAPAFTPRPVVTHVGVDLGLKEFAVLSTGERIANPRLYRTQLRKLARAQRALCRKQKGSNNRAKARKQVARIHAKIRHQRQDFLHKLSADLVRRFDLISIEDLSVRGLARTKLAKSIHDAGWGMFRTFLTYKADRANTNLMVIDRFYPSSRLCSVCGSINADLTLRDRSWTCTCGAVHDRDLQAAVNIDQEGLRLVEQNVAVG